LKLFYVQILTGDGFWLPLLQCVQQNHFLKEFSVKTNIILMASFVASFAMAAGPSARFEGLPTFTYWHSELDISATGPSQLEPNYDAEAVLLNCKAAIVEQKAIVESKGYKIVDQTVCQIKTSSGYINGVMTNYKHVAGSITFLK
jgi:hypothetical protein